MDKIERIKRYLEESKKEKQSQPISLDLSKIVDANHSKTFATKYELGKELISLTNDYTKRLESIKQDVNLSDSQIIGNIERLNVKLSENIKGIVAKTNTDKIELSELFIKKLEEKTRSLGERIDLVNEPVFKVIAGSEKKVSELEGVIAILSVKLNSLVIPKQVTVKGGKNVTVNTKETEKGIEYTINSASKEITHLYNNTTQVGGGGGGTLYAGDNISIQGLTITALVSGSTINAGFGIDIVGKTVTNTMPGISLQAGNNITIQGVTISAVGGAGSTVYAGTGINIVGGTITNTLGFVGTGGVSVSLTGNTYTIFGSSKAINTNQVAEGVSNFYYTYDRWLSGLSTWIGTSSATANSDSTPEGVSNFYWRTDRVVGIGGASISHNGLTLSIYAQSSGSPAWGDITGGLTAQTDLYAELVTKLSGTSTTNLLNEGTSNFYYNPKTFVGTGGVSVSVSGKTITIFGLSSALNTNQISEGTSNFYYNPLTFVGSVGTSVSIVGRTVTIYSGEDEGATVLGFVGAGGVSVSQSGATYTIYGASTKVDTNNTTEGNSGLYYSSVRFDASLATKTTNNLGEGTSSFYYNPLTFVGSVGTSVSVSGRTVTVYSATGAGSTVYAGTGIAISGGTITNTLGFIGTGGASVSVSGDTYTIFGLSTAVLLNNVTEGTSNFYYKVSRFVGTGGVSVSGTGLTLTIYGASTIVNTNNTTEGASGLYYSSVRFDNSLATKTTNDISEGTSNFYHRVSRFVGTGGVSVSGTGLTLTVYGASTKVNTNETTEGASGLYYSTARFTTDFGNKTTNDLAQGTSNFYYNPLTHVGTGGVSVSINGKTLTFYGASTKINTNDVTEGASGLFYSSVRFDSSLSTKTTNNLTEGTSNFYYNPLTFVGSIGTSVSVVGKTVTVYSATAGAPTIYGGVGIDVTGSTITNLLGFKGTGGVSVSVSGNTYTFFGLSTKVNTNEVTEGNSGLFYSSVRFDASLATKTTNNLVEGTSNFYYRADRFVGTGGVSVSSSGLTITIYGASTAVSSVATLTTPRLINGVAFDGSADINTESIEPTDHAVKFWTYDAAMAANSQFGATIGRMQTARIFIPYSTTVSNIITNIATAGQSLQNYYVALYNSGGSFLVQSANQATTWMTSGTKFIGISPTYITKGNVEIGCWGQSCTSNIGPKFLRAADQSTSMANLGLSAGNARWATADTGLGITAPRSVGTRTLIATTYWWALS
jgi:hypothetical protein